MAVHTVCIPVDPKLAQLLKRGIRGDGGFQMVMRGLLQCQQSRLGWPELWIDPRSVLARRVLNYYDRHGSGGYQQRLRPIAEALRPHVPPEAVTGDLFE